MREFPFDEAFARLEQMGRRQRRMKHARDVFWAGVLFAAMVFVLWVSK